MSVTGARNRPKCRRRLRRGRSASARHCWHARIVQRRMDECWGERCERGNNNATTMRMRSWRTDDWMEEAG